MVKILVLIFLVLPSWAMATDFYIAQNAAGTGDGLSYANRDDWATFNQGTPTDADNIFVAGNLTSTMTITADGTAAYINVYPCNTAFGASQNDVGTIIAVNFNGATWINLEGHVIDGTGGAVQGVMVQSAAGTSANIQIKDNTVRNADITGIQVGSDSATGVNTVIIDGNVVTGNDEEAIYSHNITNTLTIKNNIIYENGVAGQGDCIDTKPKISSLIIEDNECYNIDAAGAGTGISGIIAQSDGAIIRGNYLHDLEGGGGDSVVSSIKIFAGGYKDNSAT